MSRLAIVIGSTRPGRVGEPIARWVATQAATRGDLEVDLVDLAEVGLPLLDEPHHPRLGDYTHEHTRAWSGRIDQADAFVFVTPEYNHGYSAVLKNAIDYLYNEWQHKPVGFVSYGGNSGGLRAVQQLKQVVVALNMVPVVEAVSLPFVGSMFHANGSLEPSQSMEHSLKSMLDAVTLWGSTLSVMRAEAERL
jgi:NAD(P)H-dependent FMN reductase